LGVKEYTATESERAMSIPQTLAELTVDLIAIAAPWPLVAGAIALIVPMAFGLWLVARLTSNPLAVRSGNPPPGTAGPPGTGDVDRPRPEAPVQH
jgi:hypothetical protein